QAGVDADEQNPHPAAAASDDAGQWLAHEKERMLAANQLLSFIGVRCRGHSHEAEAAHARQTTLAGCVLARDARLRADADTVGRSFLPVPRQDVHDPGESAGARAASGGTGLSTNASPAR